MPNSRKKKSTEARAERPPEIVAAIDAGATSVRLGVAELLPDGSLHTLEELVHPVEAGADTFRLGRISPASLRALGKVFGNFARVIAGYRVSRVRAAATSAFREATNGDVVIDRIRHESGIAVEILSAVDEMRLMYGVLLPFLRRHLPGAERHTLVLDLGGGSTEILVLKGEALVSAGTRRLGTARFFHSVREAGRDPRPILESRIRNMVESAAPLFRSCPIDACVVINPILLGALSTLPEAEVREGGIEIEPARIVRLADEAEALSLETLAARFSLRPTEAEPLWPALRILERFLHLSRAKRVLVAETDFLAALLHDAAAIGTPVAAFERHILQSAESVGEKYHFDPVHARRVAGHAGAIFDAVGRFLDLDAAARCELLVAAILHDVGKYVSEFSHHKHSAYLIQWSEIVGLSETSRHRVAQIARYHRRSSPQARHLEFNALPAAERLLVRKLAGILRLADALDRDHAGTVRKPRVEMTEDELRIFADSAGDFSVAEAAIEEKASLFTEVTGLRVSLHRWLPEGA